MPEILNDEAIADNLASFRGWSVDGGQITKTYRFDTYLAGIDFAGKVARIAEDMNHHPDILILWRKVTLTISTHSAGGITDLDFKFAKAVDLP